MKDRTRNVVVGITALLGLAGFALLLMIFGYIPKVLEKNYQVIVELPEAGGLTSDNMVKLSGINIGRVQDVSFSTPPKRGVVVTLKIDGNRLIPSESRVLVFQPLLTGSPAVLFKVQHLTAQQMRDTLPTDGSAKIVADKSALAAPFQRPLDAMRREFKKPIEQFARMEKRFDELAETWGKVGRNIEGLTASRTPDQVDRGEEKANLTSFLMRADQRVSEMKQLLQTVQTAMNQFQDSAKHIDNTADAITDTAQQARRDLEKLTQKYIATADDLSALIADTRNLVNKTSDGQGSLGKLLNDPSLYDNLEDSAQRIGKAMDEIRLMIDKWNDEGVPLQF